MDAIRSYEPEYNICSLFRDLPDIRARTFTERTIKHSFQNAGMWPVSFKAVKKKLKEYGKKKKKDTGLDFLEYGSDSDNEEEEDNLGVPSSEVVPIIPEPSFIPQLSKEYLLPSLPKPPQSYMECRTQWEDIKDKIEVAISSPTRERFTIAREGIYEFLMRGSLGEMEIANARASQLRVHRAKLNS